MRIVFVGTADFAVPILKAVHAAGHSLPAVVSQPDRPAGRSLVIRPSPVKRAALELGLEVIQPLRIGADSTLDTLRAFEPDALLVVAYGQVLPSAALEVARLGAFNVHGSLLPALRGAAPVNWAIIRGFRETGVTLIRMDAGVDTGDIVAQRSVAIEERETAGHLSERLSRLGAKLAVETLPAIAAGRVAFRPQDARAASHAPKLAKDDAAIDWTQDAEALDRFIRGMTPWPGAFTAVARSAVPDLPVRIEVHRARAAEGRGRPGECLAAGRDGLLVAAGRGALRLEFVQPAGKRCQSGPDFVNGYRLAPGDRFLPAKDVRG